MSVHLSLGQFLVPAVCCVICRTVSVRVCLNSAPGMNSSVVYYTNGPVRSMYLDILLAGVSVTSGML